MSGDNEQQAGTRLIFVGESALAEGFRLVGFETFTDPGLGEVDKLFRTLLQAREKAFVVVSDALIGAKVPNLERVRREGGRVVVISVPPLNAPRTLRSEVADRLAAMFGNTGGAGP